MEKRIHQKKNLVKQGIAFLLLFGLFFFVLLQFMNDGFFDTDEGDIYVNGAALANGYDLYSEVNSQHMPFTYYLSALFWELGAQNVATQRIAFFCFFALAWTILYFRYRNIAGRATMILYPLLFCFSLCLYDLGTVVLSEHLAGIGFVILVLEFFSFYDTHELKHINCIFISFAIVLTLGTIFIAAYGLAVVAMFVLFVELQRLFQEKKKVAVWCKETGILLLKLAMWCILPWGVLFLIYAVAGNLDEAIYYAYTFNRTVYSGYQAGYGSSVIEGALAGLKHISGTISGYFAMDINITTAAQIAVGFLTVGGTIYQLVNRNYAKGIMVLFLLIATGTRGIWNFHGTQCIAVACVLASMCVWHVATEAMSQKRVTVASVIVGVCLIIISTNYLSNFSGNFRAPEPRTRTGQVLDSVTDEGEAVWSTAIGQNISMLQAKASPYRSMGVPWFTDVDAKKIMEEYPEGPTRVLLHNKENEVWGYSIEQYAPELCEYIERNYTYLTSMVYIRNDVYEEVMDLVEQEKPTWDYFRTSIDLHEDEKRIIISATNNSYEYDSVSMAIWSNDNGQDDLIWYPAIEQADGSLMVELDLMNHLLNEREDILYIHLYGTQNGTLVMIKDEIYDVSLE